MTSFLETLRIQRWDDHRYYHHSLVNQSLHLLSALSFLCAYLLMFRIRAGGSDRLAGGDDQPADRSFLL